MARVGRPPLPAGERQTTRLVRVYEGTGAKLAELVEVLGVTTADYLEPAIAKKVNADHAANIKAIRALRRSREAARKARDEAPVLSNELED